MAHTAASMSTRGVARVMDSLDPLENGERSIAVEALVEQSKDSSGLEDDGRTEPLRIRRKAGQRVAPIKTSRELSFSPDRVDTHLRRSSSIDCVRSPITAFASL